MTEKEIVDYIKRTSLSTLLVEGSNDAAIYRWLEYRLGVFSGNLLFCPGRDVRISIYRSREMFAHGKLAWLADLDMWRFSRPPSDLGGIVFTTGYSIENDLYAGTQIEALLDEHERSRHTRLLGILCRWFSFEVLEYLAGRDVQTAHHVRRMVDLDAMEMHSEFATQRGYSEPDPSFVTSLLADYKLSFAGRRFLMP